MLRLVRPILIGAGGAAATAGALYAFQQSQLASQPLNGYISPEFTVDVRSHIYKANIADDPRRKVAEFTKAVDSLVAGNLNLQTKSQSWITGYSDLLRQLGLAFLEAGKPAEALEALAAAKSIPFGTIGLRAQTASALYELNSVSKAEMLSYYSELAPEQLNTVNQLNQWGPFYIDVARIYLENKEYGQAMNVLLRFHQLSKSSTDTLCYKATASGYIAQIFQKMGEKESAESWLKISEKDVGRCRSPACKETLQVIQGLVAQQNSK